MATSQSTIDYLVDQITEAGRIRSRKMFGEYALYCDDKVVALVCDDRLYVKPTPSGRDYIGEVEEAEAYPGSKLYFLIEEERWDNRDWLADLIQCTAAALPRPKPKK